MLKRSISIPAAIVLAAALGAAVVIAAPTAPVEQNRRGQPQLPPGARPVQPTIQEHAQHSRPVAISTVRHESHRAGVGEDRVYVLFEDGTVIGMSDPRIQRATGQ